jgi:ribosomal protein S18 acetylase RimI-like enzyme
MTINTAMRRAGPADAAAVAALTRRAYAKWVPVLGREPLPMTADYDRAVVEHVVDLVEIAGELVALVEMSIEPDHLLIVNLAVDPGHQRQGLGVQLLAHAETVARRHDRSVIRLYTNRLMAANVALYQRHGYEIDRVDEWAPGSFAVHLLKRLPAG